MVESYGKKGNTESTRQRVFALLDENPSLTATTIYQLLDLSYNQNYRYLNKLKNEWKSNRENKRGQTAQVFIIGGVGVVIPRNLDPEVALEVGWASTKAKNHCYCGRII